MSDRSPIPCLRCGTCCMADMIADADAEDLARWKREGRDDILRACRDALWVGDHVLSVTTGMSIHDCPFLDFRAGTFACTIYETRPRVCHDFEPGSSAICPQFGKRPPD
ncbi:MAG: Flagellin N-methylase [Syntrophaceae bacterium PtaU1.Bin231]|nr:MAG: Flagellin N-methylase [Syntrophaceae bacterium PtaU1.Bin231]